MPAVAAAVLAWALQFAIASSGLSVPSGAAPPIVTISQHQTLGHYADGDRWIGVTYVDARPVEIELHRGWRAKSKIDRCVLAHELTHYLQAVNGLHYEPQSRAEPLAYRATAQCFEALHVSAGEVRWAWDQVKKYGGLTAAATPQPQAGSPAPRR